MTKVVLLSAALAFSAGCIQTALDSDGDDTAASRQASTTSTKLVFTPESSVGLLDVLSKFDRAYFNANGHPISVVTEIKTGYDSAQRYSVQSSYPSLSDFASQMASQDPTYTWQVENSGSGRNYLVVKPASNAYLDTPLTDFSVSDVSLCKLVLLLNEAAEPSKPGKFSCVSRTPPRFVSHGVAYDVSQQTLSISCPGVWTLQDVSLKALDELKAQVSVTVYEWDTKIQYAWEVTL